MNLRGGDNSGGVEQKGQRTGNDVNVYDLLKIKVTVYILKSTEVLLLAMAPNSTR